MRTNYTVEQFVNAGVTASIELEGVRWPMGRGAYTYTY